MTRRVGDTLTGLRTTVFSQGDGYVVSMGGTMKVLGAVRLTSAAGTNIELRGVAQRRLLCALAAANSGTVRSETLCDMLDTSPSALRTAVSRLRARTGEGVIDTDASGYRLVATLDADEFERLTRRSAERGEVLRDLEHALSLWHGDAFEEFGHETWAQASAARLNELRLVAVDDLAELLVATNRSGEAVAMLDAHVGANPYRDRSQGLLVQALAADGRQADALRSFQAYRTALADEFGTDPSSGVHAIERRVASGDSDEQAEALRSAIESGRLSATSQTASPEPEPAAPTAGSADDQQAASDLPSGVLTFLFTDIEGSTRRWEQAPEQMRAALTQHDEIIEQTVGGHDGHVFKHTGDGVGAVFTSPAHALQAAVAIQRNLQTAEWAHDDRLKIRIGLHMGESAPTRGDYFGSPVSRAARVMDIANGDQIVASASVASFARDIDVMAIGDHLLRGIGTVAIFRVSAPDLVSDDRPMRSDAGSGRKLPVQPDRLIGRETEISEVAALLEQHHSVTLLGPGGVGKTRLAIAVGTELTENLPDGAVLCELVPLSDGDAVADAVAQVLGARAQPGMTLTESIVHFLESRKMLLIFDNCEHVSDAVRDLGREIVRLTDCRILATSREPIGLPAEQLFGLQPLDAQTHGVELFVERATERDHSFTASATDIEHIQGICERVDGIPLGIELAAAWVRVLTPGQLEERLDDRFQFLRGGRSGGRHETLRDTILWSYEQLDEKQARLFDRLSVFAGGFSLEAVEAVCADDDQLLSGDVLQLLMVLVDKSMVVPLAGMGHVRFATLGTIRQFAQEQLDASADSDLYRSRHAAYFGDFAAVEAATLISHREPEVSELLDLEWANIRTGLETMLIMGDIDGATSLVLDLGWYATMSKRYELFAWVEDLFESADIETHERAASFYGLRAMAAYFTVNGASATGYANRGLELDPTDPYGYCRTALSAVSLNNELEAAASETLTADWLASLTDDSPLASRMWAEGMRAFHLCANDPSPQAEVHAQALVDIAAATGSATAAGIAHWASGMVATFDGIDGALAEWHTGLDTVQSLRSAHLVYDVIIGLVLHFTASHGDLDEVIAGTVGALEHADDHHYSAGMSHLFGVTAIVLTRLNDPETGAQLLGAMVANGHNPRPNATRTVQKALGDRTEDAQRIGQDLSINEAAAIALGTLRDAQTNRAVGA